ncbi:putative late blight resistance protein homolog R1A-10 [Coffea arabica]|uniref:Late blight resistance protein homolog R1A-10 n=1 Tax=Coffea arabica TaxID=13443 RepID=A0ABM4V9A6_COFAR
MAEVAHMYPLTSSSSFSFPRTNELGSVDLFLENLKELASCDETDHSLAFPVDSIDIVQKNLTFLRSFLENMKEKRNQNGKLKTCWNRVMEIAYKAELVIDSIVVSDKGHYFLDAVAEDINLMKIEAQEICDSTSYNGEIKRVTRASVHMPSQLTAAMKILWVLETRWKLSLTDLQEEQSSWMLFLSWDIGAWNLLRNSLPDDANGSRIMFASKYQNLSSLFKGDCKPHHLRQLTDKECWALLQTKIFGKEGCPPILSEVGFRIATNCKGLPLIVVLVSGILATTDQDCWEETAETLNASIILDTGNCMKTLEQSYSHLPDYLKPCLLYFSAFPDERDISVQRLLQLYISEGFVQKTERKSLEEVANDCLMDLIARSLVMVTRERTLGGAKACQVHDLVHEFCVEKAKLEGFVHIIDRYKDPSCPTGPCNYNPHRLCIYNTMVEVVKQSRQFFPNLRCLLFFPSYEQNATDLDLGFLMSKLLRVLDLGNFDFCESFPLEVLCLVHLRYLGINLKIDFVPSAIANLSRLHTLVVYGSITHVELPKTIWNIKTLRHLWLAKDTEKVTQHPQAKVCWSLRALNSIFWNLLWDSDAGSFESTRIPKAIGKLPNLEVLKVRDSFVGEEWEMKEGEFCNLRCLELSDLGFCRWTASADNFPRLEKLDLHYCEALEEAPSCLGECSTLEMIEVKGCSESAVCSVKQIGQEQMEMGNQGLKIIM